MSKSSKKRRIEQDLLTEVSVSKSALARLLVTLHSHGALQEGTLREATHRSVRGDLSKASAALTSRITPFGPVVQKMQLPRTSPKSPLTWCFLSPMAVVHTLGEDSEGFRVLMFMLIGRLGPNDYLTVVVWIDECRPGNILRPDKGRATQHILWTFAEFPGWLLVRDQGWFSFGVIRSTEIDDIPSGISCLMKHVVHAFDSFATTGCIVQGRLFRARFGGILGDNKGLKEVYGVKGSSGSRCCTSCKNIVQFLDQQVEGHPYLLSMKSPDKSRFDRTTDDDVWAIVDELRRIATTCPKAELLLAQQIYGINYLPEGLLFDDSLRGVLQPVKHWLRDWMHVMTVSGCANVELEQMLHRLKRANVQYEHIKDYCCRFILPQANGKVNPDWFTEKRIGKAEDRDGWKGFSSEILAVIPLVADFVEVVLGSIDIVDNVVIESFRSLDKLMKLFRLGPDEAPKHINLIERTISEHAMLFSRVYSDHVKPKYHDLFHVPDHIRSIGKLVSCFVTERRHRSVKTPAAHIYNNYETTLTAAQLCKMYGQLSDSSFRATYLDHPMPVTPEVSRMITDSVDNDVAGPFFVSNSAHLVCGHVKRGDIVMLDDRSSIGEVQTFFECTAAGRQSILAFICVYLRMNARQYAKDGSQAIVVECSRVIAPLIWAPDGAAIRIILPPISATW